MAIPSFVPVRQLVLVDLLSMMLATKPGERAIIAVDGPGGVGKTRMVAELVALADELAGRQVLSVSVDGFHRPRRERHANGRTAETFYHDSFDYDALIQCVISPFRTGRDIIPAIWDVATDAAVDRAPVGGTSDALLIVEGIFLRRPALAREWDATLLVTAPASVTVPRGNARLPDRRVPGDDAPEHPVNARHQGGQRLYEEQARLIQPTWIVDNSDLQRPELITPDPEDPQWFTQG